MISAEEKQRVLTLRQKRQIENQAEIIEQLNQRLRDMEAAKREEATNNR
jgi:hypothetical protein